ncbi:MAG: hypothetical protein WD904_04135 [Dehalococcoidia bacterium]
MRDTVSIDHFVELQRRLAQWPPAHTCVNDDPYGNPEVEPCVDIDDIWRALEDAQLPGPISTSAPTP